MRAKKVGIQINRGILMVLDSFVSRAVNDTTDGKNARADWSRARSEWPGVPWLGAMNAIKTGVSGRLRPSPRMGIADDGALPETVYQRHILWLHLLCATRTGDAGGREMIGRFMGHERIVRRILRMACTSGRSPTMRMMVTTGET